MHEFTRFINTSAPIGAKQCIFPTFPEIMTDRLTNQTTDQLADRNQPTDGHHLNYEFLL